MDPTANLNAALSLAGNGYKVFPANVDKKPLVKGWNEVATSDTNIIRGWWNTFSYALPALSCSSNGLLVVDCDRKPGKADGLALFERGCLESGIDLGDVFAIDTPSDGRHYYFSDSSCSLGNSVGKLAESIDTRGCGGYVIGPGAVLPDGRLYQARMPLPAHWKPLPASLRAALQDGKERHTAAASQFDLSRVTDGDRAYGMAALRREYDRLAATTTGRNHALNVAALALGELAGNGSLDEETVFLALRHACEKNGYMHKDGIRAMQATFLSGFGKGKANPRPLPSAQPTLMMQQPSAVQPWQESSFPFVPVKAFDPDAIPSIFDFEYKQVEFLIPNVLPTSSIVMISGDSGCGKTTFVLKLALSLALGSSFLGSLPAEPRKVLYIDKENTVRVIHERFARLKARRTPNFIHFGGHLDTEPTLEGLEDWIKRTEPKPLIVVDSMIRFLEDGSESDSKVISKFFAPLRKLSQLGATVIVLHHTGKGESTKEYRGSSDIKAALDIGWTMSNAGISQLTELKLKLFKNRVAAPEEIALKYDNGEFVLGTPEALERSSLAQLLYDHSGIVQKDFLKLAMERGLGRNRTQKFIEDGIGSGEVVLKKGTNNSGMLYSQQRMAFEQPGSVSHLQ